MIYFRSIEFCCTFCQLPPSQLSNNNSITCVLILPIFLQPEVVIRLQLFILRADFNEQTKRSDDLKPMGHCRRIMTLLTTHYRSVISFNSVKFAINVLLELNSEFFAENFRI